VSTCTVEKFQKCDNVIGSSKGCAL